MIDGKIKAALPHFPEEIDDLDSKIVFDYAGNQEELSFREALYGMHSSFLDNIPKNFDMGFRYRLFHTEDVASYQQMAWPIRLEPGIDLYTDDRDDLLSYTGSCFFAYFWDYRGFFQKHNKDPVIDDAFALFGDMFFYLYRENNKLYNECISKHHSQETRLGPALNLLRLIFEKNHYYWEAARDDFLNSDYETLKALKEKTNPLLNEIEKNRLTLRNSLEKMDFFRESLW